MLCLLHLWWQRKQALSVCINQTGHFISLQNAWLREPSEIKVRRGQGEEKEQLQELVLIKLRTAALGRAWHPLAPFPVSSLIPGISHVLCILEWEMPSLEIILRSFVYKGCLPTFL